MRKWPLTLRDTPATIWARARRYFVTEPEPVLLLNQLATLSPAPQLAYAH